jgi:mannose-1-phosphate guanylyltransferase
MHKRVAAAPQVFYNQQEHCGSVAPGHANLYGIRGAAIPGLYHHTRTMTLYATILAGGSGTRFWPKSRANFPKQFLALQGELSLLQQTVQRITSLIPPARIQVVTAAHLHAQTLEQLPDIPPVNVLSEPVGRNTAAAVGLAAKRLMTEDPDAVMVVLPADHSIPDAAAFCTTLQQAAEVVQQHDVLMTLGVKPTFPATGYGYIHVGETLSTSSDVSKAHRARGFIEKPPAPTAIHFVASGEYVWNCGIFVWRASTIWQEIHTYLPDLWQGLETYCTAVQTNAEHELLHHYYLQLPGISIDPGVLERSSRVAVLPVEFAWSDVGSWRALADLCPADSAGNTVIGQHLGYDSTHLVIYSPDKLVATIGMHDLIIVNTADALLICPKDRDQDVRELVNLLQKRGQTEYL